MAGRRSAGGSSKLWPYLFSISASFNFLLFWWQGSVPKCAPRASTTSASEPALPARKDGDIAAQLEKCHRDATSSATLAEQQLKKTKSDLEQCRSNKDRSSHLSSETPLACDHQIQHERTIQIALKDSLHTSEQQYLALQNTKMGCVDTRLELDPRWFGVEQLIRARSMAPLPKPAPQVPEQRFDITVNAFKRDMELEYSLNVYLKCMREGRAPIAKIHVVWNDAKREIPESLRNLAGPEELNFFVPPTDVDKISNRFWPLEFSSDAVFHVDDDCPHMCETLSDMFQLWRTDPDGMVGTSPRLMDLESGGRDAWFAPLLMGMYNIVFLTKGAVIHKKFLEEYWKDTWKPMREVADRYNCAEDVLFSIVHMTAVGTDHVYSIGGNVNHGRRMLLEGHSFYLEVQKVESYSGLNVRTWGVRGDAIQQITTLVKQAFPEKVAEGIYKRYQRKFWRSTVAPDLSCRMAPVPCFNRAWNSCYQDCESPVRGNSICFTGDSACYAGMGLSLRKDESGCVHL